MHHIRQGIFIFINCNNVFWKKKGCIAGIPLVFAEKVGKNLQLECFDTPLNDITWEN